MEHEETLLLNIILFCQWKHLTQHKNEQSNGYYDRVNKKGV